MPLLQIVTVLIVVGCSALAGQPLHTNAGNDQVHLECSCGDRGGVVAFEHF
jgi:hypothetical protein